MTALRVASLRAGYDRQEVLHGADLVVPSGRLVALLGPSGCGKSTLLRVVAGLHPPTSGSVVLGDVVLDGTGQRPVPAHRRGITLVPQDAALFPHLDVAANVAFGLRGSADVGDRVEHLLDLVGLDGSGTRLPHQLSGGQQQRVALARALAPRPALVLLDEPFSSLDARLRDQLRDDVRGLLAAESATGLLVTHDQGEALAIADEVAVMRDGSVLQQSSPSTLYREPQHAWTADFLGESTLLPARSSGPSAGTVLGDLPVSGGTGTTVLLRPEQVDLEARAGTGGVVVARSYRGHEWLVTVEVEGVRILARATTAPAVGATVGVGVVGAVRLVQD